MFLSGIALNTLLPSAKWHCSGCGMYGVSGKWVGRWGGRSCNVFRWRFGGDTLVTSARGGLKHCCYLPKNQQKFIP